MKDKNAEQTDAKLARLEEEKAILWTIIEDLEQWMFGEGCFISARTKAKLEIARTIMAPLEEDVKRYRQRIMLAYNEDMKPKRRRRGREKTPEEKEKQSAMMKAYWVDRKYRETT